MPPPIVLFRGGNRGDNIVGVSPIMVGRLISVDVRAVAPEKGKRPCWVPEKQRFKSAFEEVSKGFPVEKVSAQL